LALELARWATAEDGLWEARWAESNPPWPCLGGPKSSGYSIENSGEPAGLSTPYHECTHVSSARQKPLRNAHSLPGCSGFALYSDEVKNPWGFRGSCRQHGVVTESAARRVWLTYNLWTLFVRWMGLEPRQHTEAVRSWRQFLILAAQMSWSERQRTWKLAVGKEWWQQLKGCYERLCLWLKATAPQLETQRQFLRLLAFQTPVEPREWFA
jgi:hypothetical protein